jgi:hypothetical protein
LNNEIKDNNYEPKENRECDNNLPKDVKETTTTTSITAVARVTLLRRWWYGGAIEGTVQLGVPISHVYF